MEGREDVGGTQGKRAANLYATAGLADWIRQPRMTVRPSASVTLAGLGLASILSVGLVLMPTVRALLMVLALAVVAWIVLLPRGWFADADLSTRRVIYVFLGLRIAMPLISMWVGASADMLFTGGWDAFGYHDVGAKVAADLVATGKSLSHGPLVPGTGAINLAVGYFYAVASPVRIASFYLWDASAVIGMLLFWWATNHLAGDRQRQYAMFVLLTPTLLFWNAGLGKEAPLTLATGCIVAGVHLLSARSGAMRGLVYLALGAVVAGFVRPHVALLLMLSALIGVGFGASRLHSRSKATTRRLVPLVAVGTFLIILFPVTHAFFDPVGELSLVDAAYSRAEVMAAVGGRSSFETSPPRSALDVPEAVVTVLFRPFPWEVRTVPQLLASAEAMVIGTMLARALRGVAKRRMRFERSSLVVMSMTFVVSFCVAFASLGNFGLLVRQRSQVLPFVILLVFSVRSVGSEALRSEA